ncbi:MAG: lysophospholipid acyltransferase family protein [Desulfobacterales bacterium]
MNLFSYLLRYLLAVLSLILMYSLALLVGLINRAAAWRIIVSWGHFFLKLFGVEVAVEYENQNIDLSSGGVVIGLTQQSLLDPIIGQVIAPRIFMSIWNIEYTLIPFIGWISWLFGWVIIRQWPKQAKGKLEKAVSYLRKGGLVYLSIEGKRSTNGSLSPYKKGAVVLAIQANARIIPVIYHDSHDCLSYGEWKIRPGKVTAKIFSEISTDGMGYEDRDLLVGQLRKLAEREIQLWASTKNN